MKKYCFNCQGDDFYTIQDSDGEEVGRECKNCGAQELYNGYRWGVNGDIHKVLDEEETEDTKEQ